MNCNKMPRSIVDDTHLVTATNVVQLIILYGGKIIILWFTVSARTVKLKSVKLYVANSA